MATFCTKCGVALPPDTRFCLACGAPVASAGAPPQPAPPVQPAYTPVPTGYSSPAPVAPANSGGGGFLKILLIVVLVFVALGVLAAAVVGFGIWRVSRAVHLDHKGNGLSLSTPAGTYSAGGDSSVSESDLGTEIYPGAARGEGGMQIHSANGSMVTAVYTTSDPPAKVVDFYKGKLGANAMVMETGNGEVLSGGSSDKDRVTITVSAAASPDGKTKILIMHTTSNRP